MLRTTIEADDPADPNPAIPPGPDFTVFGYSQSAVVASLVKKDLIANRPADGTDVSFFLLANPMRPNGGVLARGPEGLTIPIIGITFYGATPTNSCETGECYETVDTAAQYDGLGGDAPASITNLLAIANAALGYYYLHGDLQNGEFDDAQYQGSHGDTDYYIVPARRLPLLMPFESFVPSPILTLLEAPLKAAIEAGYARDVNPGVATKVGLLPFRDPVAAIVNIIKAIPVGIDDAIAEASADPQNRPLGTAPVTSPFGVGGPELPEPPVADDANANLMFSRTSDRPAVQQDVPERSSVSRSSVKRAPSRKRLARAPRSRSQQAVSPKRSSRKRAPRDRAPRSSRSPHPVPPRSRWPGSASRSATLWTRSGCRRSGVRSGSIRRRTPSPRQPRSPATAMAVAVAVAKPPPASRIPPRPPRARRRPDGRIRRRSSAIPLSTG